MRLAADTAARAPPWASRLEREARETSPLPARGREGGRAGGSGAAAGPGAGRAAGGAGRAGSGRAGPAPAGEGGRAGGSGAAAGPGAARAAGGAGLAGTGRAGPAPAGRGRDSVSAGEGGRAAGRTCSAAPNVRRPGRVTERRLASRPSTATMPRSAQRKRKCSTSSYSELVTSAISPATTATGAGTAEANRADSGRLRTG